MASSKFSLYGLLDDFVADRLGIDFSLVESLLISFPNASLVGDGIPRLLIPSLSRSFSLIDC